MLKQRKHAECGKCGRDVEIIASGLCNTCYMQEYRKQIRAETTMVSEYEKRLGALPEGCPWCEEECPEGSGRPVAWFLWMPICAGHLVLAEKWMRVIGRVPTRE